MPSDVKSSDRAGAPEEREGGMEGGNGTGEQTVSGLGWVVVVPAMAMICYYD